jgi:activator of Hsp90 ATPase-like protein
MSDENGHVVPPSELGLPAGHPTTTEILVELDELDVRTRMTMTHVGVPEGSPGAVGWEMALDTLAAHIAAHRNY